MRSIMMQRFRWFPVMAVLLLLGASPALAAIQGVTGTTFNLTAKADHISTPDGGSIHMWGYALNNGRMQYPGPTLILNQGDTISITLTNNLPPGAGNVSILAPGQSGGTATGGVQGLITREAPPGGSVTYNFVAAEPGTYAYYSGTRPELQVEMGLIGTIIVRPAGFNEASNKTAYGHPETRYDDEFLFLLSEMDPNIHELVEAGLMNMVDNTKYFPVYWFINGRAAPDTMLDANVSFLPTQPYNCLPMTRPGGRLLMRIVNASRDLHPYHTHGNHHKVIAFDGRLLESAPGAGPDLAVADFTTSVPPGGTADGVFQWYAKAGWDIYGTDNGHDCVDGNGDDLDDSTYEYCPDHGKPFPVDLPHKNDTTFGAFWGGGPFLGTAEPLPPGEGGFNPNGAYFFMWHSHSEKELTNFDIFPGGMLTMMFVEPPSPPLINP